MSANGGMLPLPLIKNKKTVNPRDSASAPVFQLETAMGSAIECFEGAGAVLVPRKRFAPVKTCADLFCLRSDAYTLTPASTVELATAAQPLIKLDDKHYKLVDKMEALVEAYPSLLDCTALTVRILWRNEVCVAKEACTTRRLRAHAHLIAEPCIALTPRPGATALPCQFVVWRTAGLPDPVRASAFPANVGTMRAGIARCHISSIARALWQAWIGALTGGRAAGHGACQVCGGRGGQGQGRGG